MRFPGFTDEWISCRISDYGDIVTGTTPSTSQEENYSDGKYLWASPSDLGTEKYVHTTQTMLSKMGFEKTRALPPTAILVTCIGSTIGKMGMAKYKMSTNQQINSIIVSPEFDANFVYYAIQSKFPRYISSIAVQAVPILSKSEFGKLSNSKTSIEEQKKIGHLFSIIDERIATQNKIIEELQSLIKGLNDSFHDNEHGESISIAELGHSYSGLSGKSGDDFGQGSPYITYLNVFQNNVANEDQIGLVTVDENESQNTISYGDVLFTLSSETPEETGIGCVYLGESSKYYLNSFCFGVRITQPNKVYLPYLAYLVSSSKFRRFVYPLAQGSTRFNLQKNDFMKKKFMLLPIDKQKEVSKILDTLNDKLSVECRLLDLYINQKSHLLRSMFI